MHKLIFGSTVHEICAEQVINDYFYYYYYYCSAESIVLQPLGYPCKKNFGAYAY